MSNVEGAENRVMFSCWDGGRCHFTRTMALAEEAQDRGMEVGFVVSEKYAAEIGSLAIPAEVFVIPTRQDNIPPAPYEFPLYSHAFRHAQRLRGLRFNNVPWLQETTEREITAIKDFKPGVIVNDYRDTIRTSAQVCEVPVVGITHTTGNVDGNTFGWWADPPSGAKLPDCRDSFNEVRERFGLPAITDEREMFSGDISLIPSSPSLEPLARDSDTTFYVGMLSKWRPDNSGFRTIGSTVADPRIFSYVGETTRPQYGYEAMLTEVIGREPNMGFYVVGDPTRYQNDTINERQRQGSVMVERFIPGPIAIGDSAVTLNHGGHGTTMLSLALGKPLICIGPYQSECASSFHGAEQGGAGIMLNHSEGPLERRSAPDLGEGVEIFALGQCGTSLAMYVDADVTFSERCFEQVADKFTDPAIQAGGAVPRYKIPSELQGTYLGQIHRTRQLYYDAAGPWMIPIGRMVAFRTAAIDAFFENTAAEDAWLINTIAQNYGWEAIQVAQDASVYAAAQRTWVDYIKQESRFTRGNEHLFESFPELEVVFDAGRHLRNQRLRSRTEIEEVIRPIMESEGMPIRLIDELEVIMKIYHDNAHLMAEELVSATGKWEPVASTKLPVTQEEATS